MPPHFWGIIIQSQPECLSTSCLLCMTGLNQSMGSLGRTTYTVHLISAPVQSERIQIYPTKYQLRAYCRNIFFMSCGISLLRLFRCIRLALMNFNMHIHKYVRTGKVLPYLAFIEERMYLSQFHFWFLQILSKLNKLLEFLLFEFLEIFFVSLVLVILNPPRNIDIFFFIFRGSILKALKIWL